MLYAIVMDNDASLPFFSFSSGKYSDYKYQIIGYAPKQKNRKGILPNFNKHYDGYNRISI